MGTLKDISTPRMVRLTEAWLDPQRERSKIEALPSGKALMTQIEVAHTGILSTQKKDTVASKEITIVSDKQAGVDRTHDRKIRGCWLVLTGFAELADDPNEAEAFLAVRDDLLPNGISVTKNSYEDEAGVVELTEARISDGTRNLLKNLPIPGGKLLNAVEDWFAAGRELGQLEDQKKKLASSPANSGPSKSDALRARNFWIQACGLTGSSTRAMLGVPFFRGSHHASTHPHRYR